MMEKTILLVEDDVFIRNNVCSLLQQEGYHTAACSSLEEARITKSGKATKCRFCF